MPDTVNDLKPYASLAAVDSVMSVPDSYDGWEYRSRETATGLRGEVSTVEQ